MDPFDASSAWALTDVIDPYTKAPDEFCIASLIAISIGPGALYLPGAMSYCGFVPGSALMCMVFFMQHSLAQRMIEAPELLCQDLELYTDIARSCFSPHTHGGCVAFLALLLCKIMHLLALFGSCVVHMLTISWILDSIWNGFEDNPEEHGWVYRLGAATLCLFILLLPAGFLSTHVRGMWRSSRICVWIMRLVLATVMVTAFLRRVVDGSKSVSYTPFADFDGVLLGLAYITFAFNGLQYLPYVFADMYSPGNATKVCTKVYRQIFIFYVVLTCSGYIGWGDEVRHNGNTTILTTPDIGWLLQILMLVQAIASYPLVFAPLARTVECVLELESAPQLSLHLPWAIRQLKFRKIGLQVALVFGGLTAKSFLSEFPTQWIIWISWLPGNFTQCIFPAVFALVLDSRRRSWQRELVNLRVNGGGLARNTLAFARDSLQVAREVLEGKKSDGCRWFIPVLSIALGFFVFGWGLYRSVNNWKHWLGNVKEQTNSASLYSIWQES